jgi:uncharacterized protein (TIGR03437 family)
VPIFRSPPTLFRARWLQDARLGIFRSGAPDAGNAFVTKIAPDGSSLVFSALLGGLCGANGGGTIAEAVTVDPNGETWIAGATAAQNLPVTPNALQPQFGGGGVDGFVARFSADGALGYASYLGGSGEDWVDGIALDVGGNIYLSGASEGLSQSTSSGSSDLGPTSYACIFLPGQDLIREGVAYLARLDPDGSAVSRLAYLGGDCATRVIVAVDATGAPWFAGSSFANGGFPTVAPLQIGFGGGFLGKLTPDFTQLTFSTSFNSVNGLALDSNGDSYVAGDGAYLAKIDPAPPAVSLDQVLPSGSAALNNFVAPGEVLRLLGKNLGPSAATPGVINAAAFVVTSVAGVQVNFGAVAAPLLSVSAGEIDCVVPFEAVGASTTTITVQYNNAQSNPVTMAVIGSDIEILGVFNEDFSVNSASNPAAAGSIMSAYIAGVGQTVPPSLDGQVNQAPLGAFGTPIRASYFIPYAPTNTLPILPVTYVGAAAGAIAGVLQVNFFAPPQNSSVSLLPGSGTFSGSFNVSVQ